MSAPHYQIIRRPIITEKGLGVKETQHTVVFEVASGATKTQIKEAVQQIFKVKVDDVRTANFHGKMRRRRQNEGYRRDAVYGLKLLSPISASCLLNLSATAAAKLY